MRTIAGVVSVAAAHAACPAQDGLFAFSRSGSVHVVETGTGVRRHRGELGVEVVAAARFGLRVWVMSPHAVLHHVDPTAARVIESRPLWGLPPGASVSALHEALLITGYGLFAIVADAAGDNWLYRVHVDRCAMEPLAPTGLRGIRGFGGRGYEVMVITARGEMHALSPSSGTTSPRDLLWPAGGPWECMAEDANVEMVAVGAGFWSFSGGQWRPVQWVGFRDLVAMIDHTGSGCAAECDSATSAATLDIFDFLCFQNRFAAGDPWACDCDEGTGFGVCDVFDYLCYEELFARGCP